MPKGKQTTTLPAPVEQQPTPEVERTYIVLSRAWYGKANLDSMRPRITDEITLLLTDTERDALYNLEAHIEWVNLGKSGSHPRFTAFGESLPILPFVADVLAEWAALEHLRERSAHNHPHTAPVTVAEICAMLDRAGWTDATPLTPPNS